MTSVTLYGSIICPYVHRVRFALEALKINYTYEEVDLFSDQQKTEEYKKVNPFGKVPTLKVHGSPLYESLALLEYLENEFGGVFPKDNVAKTQQRIWVSYFDSNVASKFFGIFGKLKAKDQEGAVVIVKEVIENIKFLVKNSGLEESIKKNPNSYFDGNTLTYADYAIVPHARVFDIYSKALLGKSLFDFGEGNELIESFRTYTHNVTKTESYQAITDKLQVLPFEHNSLLKLLKIEKTEQFNFEVFIEEYLRKKFFA